MGEQNEHNLRKNKDVKESGQEGDPFHRKIKCIADI